MLKFGLILIALSSAAISSSGFAAANESGTDLCPKYRCVAAPHSSDFRHQIPGYGYNDDLDQAKAIALQNCSNNYGGSCAIELCEPFTGPVLKIFNSCQSQW